MLRPKTFSALVVSGTEFARTVKDLLATLFS